MGSAPQPARNCEDSVYNQNLRLNRIEYSLERSWLWSRPVCLGLVLGTACNMRCLHCYQARTGDLLIPPGPIGREFRREISALYPFLSTLRISGGEVFALPGFAELLDDVAASTGRPVVSVSTNGTLIDDAWAERIVRTPFLNVTFSIDAATPETFARLRRGARLEDVLGGLARLQEWRRRLNSALPRIDSFFVVMRSNFREIPGYLKLLTDHGVTNACLQLMEITPENAVRAADEVLSEYAEVSELHSILREAMAASGSRVIRLCGVRTLFESHGLDASFTDGAEGLHPEPGDGAVCPNPWTTLFLDETGAAYLCFLSQPVGNIYEMPLERVWNGPEAVAKRTGVLSGRYLASGCGEVYCAWREGLRGTPSEPAVERDLLREMGILRRRLRQCDPREPESELAAVRGLIQASRQRNGELRGLLDPMEELLEAGERHIRNLEAKAAKAVADFEAVRAEYDAFRRPLMVRAAARLSRLLARTRLLTRAVQYQLDSEPRP